MGGTGHAFDLKGHQTLGGEANHLAQQIGVGTLFQKRAKAHHLVGHRWILSSVAWFSDQTLPMIRDDHRKPLARYRAARVSLGLGSDVAAGPELSLVAVMRAGAYTQNGLRVLGETNWGPVSAMSNMMQGLFGVIAPGHIAANMIASCVVEPMVALTDPSRNMSTSPGLGCALR